MQCVHMLDERHLLLRVGADAAQQYIVLYDWRAASVLGFHSICSPILLDAVARCAGATGTCRS